MRKSFNQNVIEALNYYVYALVDPRNKKIFYVGKGKGNRIYQHEESSLDESNDNLKLSTIRDIHGAGLKVEHYIIRHNLTEQEAFLVESAIIDLLTYKPFNRENILTNIACGHHQWDEGIKTDSEINILYDCEKIKPVPGERLLLVSLNRSYLQSKATGVYKRANDYESARKYWAISAAKAEKIDYILGVYKGIVRIVIDVKSYTATLVAENGTVFRKPRFVFEGDIVPDSPYLNKDVTDYPFISGNPIKYINIP